MTTIRLKSWLLSCWLAIGIALSVQTGQADEFAPGATLYRQLLTPMTSVIDGKPFRDALEQIASQVHVNLWVDRRVDPTADINAGSLGPNVYAAINKIAQQRDCVVMPVAGVLLVGRADWVDATAAALIRLPDAADSVNKTTYSWDALATPGEALEKVAGELKIQMKLPHDLWPATRWTALDQRVATTLVLAQFDRRPSDKSFANQRLAVVRLDASLPCERVYRTAKQSTLLRQTIEKADGQSNVKLVGSALTVTAKATAHRLATAALLADLSKNAAPPPDEDKRRFSLELKAVAGDAIREFAKTANVACVIETDAEENCRTRVTLSAKQKSLRELIEMVAKAADLKVTWQPGKVVISK